MSRFIPVPNRESAAGSTAPTASGPLIIPRSFGSGRLPLISPRHVGTYGSPRQPISHSLNQSSALSGAAASTYGYGQSGGSSHNRSSPPDAFATVPASTTTGFRSAKTTPRKLNPNSKPLTPSKLQQSANKPPALTTAAATAGATSDLDRKHTATAAATDAGDSSPPSPVKFGRPARPNTNSNPHTATHTATTRAIAAAIGVGTPVGSYRDAEAGSYVDTGSARYTSMMMPQPVAVSSLPSTLVSALQRSTSTASAAPGAGGNPDPFISVGARPQRTAPDSGGSSASVTHVRVRRVRAASAVSAAAGSSPGDEPESEPGVDPNADSSFDMSDSPQILRAGEVASSYQYSGDGSDAATSAERAAVIARDKRLIDSYFIGQLSNVIKMGVWWATFGLLVLAMFRGNPLGVAAARLCFNTSMLVFSPVAGALVERVSARSLLTGATIARGILYVALIPLSWLFLRSEWFTQGVENWVYYAVFLSLLFIDGGLVALANVVDCDCGGIELVAAQYGTAPISDATRRALTTTHEACFDAGMIVLTPLVAAAGYALDNYFQSVSSDDSAIHGVAGSVGAIVFVLAAVFAITSFISASAYACGLPALPPPPPDSLPPFCTRLAEMYGFIWAGFGMCWSRDLYAKQQEIESAYTPLTAVDVHPPATIAARGSVSSAASAGAASAGSGSGGSGGGSVGTATPPPAASTGFGTVIATHDSPPHSIGSAAGGTATTPAIPSAVTHRSLAARSALRWRLFFLALETSFEDAVISIIIAVYAIDGYTDSSSLANAGSDGDTHSYSKGLLLAACIIAFGKCGGVISSRLVHRHWTPPAAGGGANASQSLESAFRPLFVYVFLGGVCTLLFPLAAELRSRGFRGLPYVVVSLASFLYFLFSTGPKIGFATLIQSLAAESDASGPVFTFIAAFLTFVDSVVLLAVAGIFASVGVSIGLWLVCGLIAVHGLIELIVGPALLRFDTPTNAGSADATGAGTAGGGIHSAAHDTSTPSSFGPSTPLLAAVSQRHQQHQQHASSAAVGVRYSSLPSTSMKQSEAGIVGSVNSVRAGSAADSGDIYDAVS